jgi:sulfur-oxidizing protein SoxZ
MSNTRIQVPAEVKSGETFEVRVLIRHPMETGYRYDDRGQRIPQNVVHHVLCRYNGVEVFRAELSSGIAANPYLTFFIVATASGELEVSWTDDTGATEAERATIAVIGS